MIRVEDLHFAYGANTILAGVSLAVRDGECLVVTGGNGSGKSTLLKCIFGLERPRSGRVYFDDRDITYSPVDTRRKIGMSYLFQGRRIFDLLTVHQNIALAIGRANAVSISKSMELLSAMSDGSIAADRLGSELSGGQARIVAIVCAFASESKVMLLDEPSENLSPAAREVFWSYLVEQRVRDGLSIVLVTHSVDEAKRVGNSFCRMENGQIWGISDQQ